MKMRIAGALTLVLAGSVEAGTTTLSVLDAAAGQGNGTYTPMSFTVERTGDLSYPVEIEFASEADAAAANPAVPDVDFLARSIPSFMLPAGESRPTVPVSILRAAAGRPDRGLVLRIASRGIPRFESRRDVCVGGDAVAVAPADFNGDGLPDLAVADNESGRVLVCMNRSTEDEFAFSGPSFLSLHTGEWPYQNITGIAAGDLDADGRADLVASNGSNNKIFVLANRTPDFAEAPEFEIVQTLPVFNRPGTVTLADLNGDGRRDILVGGEVGSCGSICTSDLYLFANVTAPAAAGPSFQALDPLRSRAFVWRILAEDFTGDGRTDLVATTSEGLDLFVNTTSAPGLAPSFGARSGLLDVTDGVDVDAADLDDDGRRDLAVVYENKVWVMTALGGGAFDAPEMVYVEPLRESGHQEMPVAVRALDFNNDRKLDLAVGNYLVHVVQDGERVGHSLVTLLENRTAPGIGYRFVTDGELEVAGVFQEFSIADMNADERSDIVTPSYFESRVSVLRRADRAVDIVRPQARGTVLATLPPLEFAAVTGAAASSTVASEEVTISGITYDAPVTISEGAYLVNGERRTGISRVRAGDVVRVEVQSAATAGAERKASLMVGGVGGDFSVKTAAVADDAAAGGGPLAPATAALLLLAALLRRRADRGVAFQ